MSLAEPAWLLLAWAGLVASAVAALAGAPPGATTLLDRARQYRRSRAASFVRAVVLSTLVGVVLYPIVYGTIFEAAGRADLPLGAGIGAVHAILALVVRALRRIPGPHAAPLFRLVLSRLAYGAVIGFLYVVPPGFS